MTTSKGAACCAAPFPSPLKRGAPWRLFLWGLMSGISRCFLLADLIACIVESSIAGIAFAVGRWLWPYRRMPLEQDAGGQP